MSQSAPQRVFDPVCGMAVNVAEAVAGGLTMERDGRTYAFCAKSCLKDFLADPAKWTAEPDAPARTATALAMPVIDDGLRRWYASCRCCMTDAHPDVVATLDAERVRSKQAVSGPGICEIAEGAATPPRG